MKQIFLGLLALSAVLQFGNEQLGSEYGDNSLEKELANKISPDTTYLHELAMLIKEGKVDGEIIPFDTGGYAVDIYDITGEAIMSSNSIQ